MGQTGPLGKNTPLSDLGLQKLDGGPPERLESSPDPVHTIPVIGTGDHDVFPTQRRDVGHNVFRNRNPLFLYQLKSPIQISCVPQDDGGDDQIKGHRVEILIELGAVTNRAATIETDSALQCVMSLSFIEY